MKRNLKREIKGITLVALVVTIVVLLILAGIAMALTLGENGIIGRTLKAKDEYEKAKKEEEEVLENLYSTIKIADNDDAEITIKMKELKNIIQETVNEEIQKGMRGINSNSLLVVATNENLNIEEFSLDKFNNTFTEGEFNKYFEYNEETGELICKLDGWYSIDLNITIGHAGDVWSNTELKCVINENDIFSTNVSACRSVSVANNNNSMNIYMKNGDRLEFKKIIRGSNSTSNNDATIRILKM